MILLRMSLSCKLVPVQYREYEYGLLLEGFEIDAIITSCLVTFLRSPLSVATTLKMLKRAVIGRGLESRFQEMFDIITVPSTIETDSI